MKAKRLRYAADAIQDLADIRSYLKAQASARVAARMIERIRATIVAARELPTMGTPRPEYARGCRFVIEQPYVIYYDFDGECLTVLRILHHARDRDAEMKEGD